MKSSCLERFEGKKVCIKWLEKEYDKDDIDFKNGTFIPIEQEGILEEVDATNLTIAYITTGVNPKHGLLKIRLKFLVAIEEVKE